MDTVFISGLTVETIIGVYDWEREVTQRLVIDLDMGWDNRRPGNSDDVADALDYKAVSDEVAAFFQAFHPQLLETAAERLADRLLERFAMPWLRLRIAKPGAVPAADSVGVVIERGERV
ncbi:dihydroneopterin aldolase [Mangrovitalea sediminis]|uniref:dihydroneopterin aldolase n=1 Tax=Mangrovitalea sediminis TaxID=1982043 RepID=UPI0018E9B956|nr:dihydroneopterin aldolase [Mangrovitalea sediminis]